MHLCKGYRVYRAEGNGAGLDAAGSGGEMRRTILDLYCRTATLKARPAACVWRFVHMC